MVGSPSGVRTRVTGVRGRRPRPLDDGTINPFLSDFNTANMYLMSNYKFASRYFCNSMGILGFKGCYQRAGLYLSRYIRNPVFFPFLNPNIK